MLALSSSQFDPKRPTRAVDYNEFRCPWMSGRSAEHQYDLIGERELLTQL
jgi:hypothetical protein